MSLPRDRARDTYMGITPGEKSALSDRHRKILRIMSSVPCGTWLDIGCGDGNFTSLAARELGSDAVYGIDISPKAVEMARLRGVQAQCLNLDEQDLPFEAGFFDLVLCGEVIEHLFDPDRLLDNVWRVLKAGGSLIITTPNLASIYNRIALFLGFQPFDTAVSLRHAVGHLIEVRGHGSDLAPGVDHVRVFTYRSLLSLLRLHGFRIASGASGASIATWKVLPWYLRPLKIFDWLICLYPPLSFRVVVAAIKEGAS